MLSSKKVQEKNHALCLGEPRKISQGTNDLSIMSGGGGVHRRGSVWIGVMLAWQELGCMKGMMVCN